MAHASWSIAQGVVLEQMLGNDAASDEVVEIVWDALLERFTTPIASAGGTETR
jgi:hypothetical protein